VNLGLAYTVFLPAMNPTSIPMNNSIMATMVVVVHSVTVVVVV